MVNVLIRVDSFATYVQQHNLDDIAARVTHLLLQIERCAASTEPEWVSVDTAFETITAMVDLTSAMHYRPLKKSDVESSPHMTLYWPDLDEIGEITSQLEHYGYASDACASPAKAVKTALKMQSSAVVLDISRESPASLDLYLAELNKRIAEEGKFEQKK